MIVSRLSVLALCFAGAAVQAKPLISSSEETAARICMARELEPKRIVEACDVALGEAGLTLAQRVDMMVARGDGLFWQDHFVEAANSYRAATGIDPAATDAWNGLGWALWETDGDAAALEAFEASLKVDVSVQGLGGKAATARRSGVISNEEARTLLNAALAIDPDYIWAVRELGWSHIEDRNYSDAKLAFREALDIEPQDVNARYGLGRAKLSTGAAEEALTIFNDALADAPEDFSLKVYRIIALRNLDRNAQALRHANRLIAENPDRSSGYIERGLSLVALERRAEAIETYQVAEKKIGPDNAILYWYADALSTDGRFQEALQVIDRGLTLDKADYSDHLLESYIALELENYPLARKAAEDSLATGVNDPWAHYYIAITMVHDGAVNEAVTQFSTAMAAGLPQHRVGAFARELISAGKYVEAAQLRLNF
ncbi:MAG: tetratricopeptide repeat protein [Paracoccaceae bacterium]